MVTNASIIASELGWGQVFGGKASAMPLCIRHALPFPGENVVLSPNALYVVPLASVDAAARMQGSFVLCGVGNAGSVVVGSGCEAVVPPRDMPADVALQMVQESISAAWELVGSVQSLLSVGDSSQDALRLLTQGMRNPVALMNAAFMLIGVSGNPPESGTDVTWDEALSQGFSSGTHRSREELARTLRLAQASDLPVTAPFGEVTEAVATIKRDGETVGYLGITDSVAPFDDAELSRLHRAQVVMASCPELRRPSSLTSGRPGLVLERLLSGSAIEESALDSFLGELQWHATGSFRLGFLFLQGERDTWPSLFEGLCRELRDSLWLRVVLPYEEGIVVLDRADEGRLSRGDARLGAFLARHGMRCVLSQPFQSLAQLRHAYLQCRIAQSLVGGTGFASLGIAMKGHEETIVSFTECFQDVVVGTVASGTSLRALCDPRIARLAQDKAGRRSIDTIREYLACGQSATKASERLFIHRNTLLYRIERLEQELDLRFKDLTPEEEFALHLACVFAGYLD